MLFIIETITTIRFQRILRETLNTTHFLNMMSKIVLFPLLVLYLLLFSVLLEFSFTYTIKVVKSLKATSLS